MTVEECERYVESVGMTCDATTVTDLHTLTEGWPAGVALAALAARSEGGGNGLPTSLGGRRREIADYFVEEVLDALDHSTRSFLLASSVVPRLSAPLLDAMLERNDSERRLDVLIRTNVFVVPLDHERRWFRYHRLFRELLADRLERERPDAAPDLLHRAARWHAEHGTVDEAVECAQRSGDLRLTGQLLLGRWSELVSRGQLDTLAQWTGRSSDEQIASDPAYSISWRGSPR